MGDIQALYDWLNAWEDREQEAIDAFAIRRVLELLEGTDE